MNNPLPQRLAAPHRPSRKTAIAFFIFSLAVASGVIAWVFFINFGTLALDGEMPFNVSAGDEEVTCVAAPCTIKLKPGNVTVTFKKEGYFDAAQTVQVRRWSEVPVRGEFTFIPVVREIGEAVLPFDGAPLRSPFLGTKRLEKFPNNSGAVFFSGSGELALVTLGREMYVYDITEHLVFDPELLAAALPVWMGETIVFLERGEHEDRLMRWDEKQSSAIAMFEKPFVKPKLFGAPRQDLILIEDELGPMQRIYYLVDAAQKSRKRLYLGSAAVFHGWAGEYMVFGAPLTEAGTSVFLVHPAALHEIPIPAADPKNVIEGEDGKIIFFADKKADTDGPKLGTSISEMFEKAVNETAGKSSGLQQEGSAGGGGSPEKKDRLFFLTEFDSKNNVFHSLVNVAVGEGEAIERLTADEKAKRLYFLKGGKLWEAVLEK